ncbi:MAG: ribulose-phosphate 3-epimerase, partial [Oscillospiraceae bacterium]|nr:ribulose-phosphate 3-epimerase [Oscillospiraceae bacterium]
MENKKVQIAPSLLSADFSRLAEELADIKTAGADMVHIDVMDGHFVDNITIGPPVVAALRKCSDLFFDVHLMIDEPSKYIKAFAEAGADSINFHEETSENKSEVIGLIKSFGAKPALTVKPGTPIERVYPYLDKLYMVLIMTVEPGFGGQAFI